MSIQKIDKESKGLKYSSICGLALLSVLAGSGTAKVSTQIKATQSNNPHTEKVADSESYDDNSSEVKSNSNHHENKKDDKSSNKHDDKTNDDNSDDSTLSNMLAEVVQSTTKDVKQAAAFGSKSIAKDIKDGMNSIVSALDSNPVAKNALMTMKDVSPNLLKSSGGPQSQNKDNQLQNKNDVANIITKAAKNETTPKVSNASADIASSIKSPAIDRNPTVTKPATNVTTSSGTINKQPISSTTNESKPLVPGSSTSSKPTTNKQPAITGDNIHTSGSTGTATSNKKPSSSSKPSAGTSNVPSSSTSNPDLNKPATIPSGSDNKPSSGSTSTPSIKDYELQYQVIADILSGDSKTAETILQGNVVISQDKTKDGIYQYDFTQQVNDWAKAHNYVIASQKDESYLKGQVDFNKAPKHNLTITIGVRPEDNSNNKDNSSSSSSTSHNVPSATTPSNTTSNSTAPSSTNTNNSSAGNVNAGNKAQNSSTNNPITSDSNKVNNSGANNTGKDVNSKINSNTSSSNSSTANNKVENNKSNSNTTNIGSNVSISSANKTISNSNNQNKNYSSNTSATTNTNTKSQMTPSTPAISSNSLNGMSK